MNRVMIKQINLYIFIYCFIFLSYNYFHIHKIFKWFVDLGVPIEFFAIFWIILSVSIFLSGVWYFYNAYKYIKSDENGFDLESNANKKKIKKRKSNKAKRLFPINKEHFLGKVKTLAFQLNDAWCNHKMNTVRNLVSAGIYNRFKIQLSLMEKSSIQNVMKDWTLDKLKIVSQNSDQLYDVVHVKLVASAKDILVNKGLSESEKQTKLNASSKSSYTEYWSFVRKVSARTNTVEGLLSNQCPKCGFSIGNLGESNQCPSCKAILNSGEYDWVLSEITQDEVWDPYLEEDFDLEDLNTINPTVNKLTIEDRTSYLFWRWIEASSINSKEPLIRDVTDQCWENISFHKTHLSNVAVGAVDLEDIYEEKESIQAEVSITWSGAIDYQSEPKPFLHVFYLRLRKDLQPISGFSENSCLNCGAPLPENNSIKCEYCNNTIPMKVDNWLLDKIEDLG